MLKRRWDSVSNGDGWAILKCTEMVVNGKDVMHVSYQGANVAQLGRGTTSSNGDEMVPSTLLVLGSIFFPRRRFLILH